MAIKKWREQEDLYIASVTRNEKWYPDTADLTHLVWGSSGTSLGVSYQRDNKTAIWHVEGTASSLGSEHRMFEITRWTVVDADYLIPGKRYLIYQNPLSRGDFVPVRIKVTLTDGTSQSFMYPSSSDNIHGVIYPHAINIPDNANRLEVYFVVEAGAEVNADIAYVIQLDTLISDMTYGDSFSVEVKGGSGSGSLHYSVKPITGNATISQTGVLTYQEPGTIWVDIYKEGSNFSTDPDTGLPINGYYQRSKHLILEVELDQKQITVRVIPETYTQNIGTSIPSTSVFSYTVEGLVGSDSLARNPVIYFVNNSADFYNFDVLSRANSESGFNNGIHYVKNNDGSWHIYGSRTSTISTYNLITSPLELPHYIHKGEKYQLKLNGGSVPLQIEWYRQESQDSSSVYTYDSTIEVPDDATGVLICFYLYGTTTWDATVNYNLINITERSINNKVVSEYPVAAKGAKKPNKSGYKDTIRYRSAKLKFDNLAYYGVYTYYDSDMGRVELSSYSVKPYNTVRFSIQCCNGVYYQESEITIYYYEDGVRKNITPTPETDPTLDPSTSLPIEGAYKFEMPISNVYLSVDFYYMGDHYIPIGGRYPYTDISKSYNTAEIMRDQIYQDALLFCYYARKYYHSELGTPLMQGVGINTFYNSNREHRILRKDAIDVLRRISHGITQSYSSNNVSMYPDTVFNYEADSINAPMARLFTYAGYYPIEWSDEGVSVRARNIDLSEPRSSEDYVVATPVGIGTNVFAPSILSNVTSGGTANDDYIAMYHSMPSIAWNAWVGIVNGVNELSVAGNTFMTIQEAAALLWRYAKFRQLDIQSYGNYRYDSWADEWAQGGPLNWAASRGIIPENHMVYDAGGGWRTIKGSISYGTGNLRIYPNDYVDRADFAYMIMKFCSMYAW